MMEILYFIYDFKDNKLMLNNWVNSVYLSDSMNKNDEVYFFVENEGRNYMVREDGIELFTDLDAREIMRLDRTSVEIVMANGDILIGNLETGEVERESAQSVRTESRKTSGKIIRISNDKLNKLFIY